MNFFILVALIRYKKFDGQLFMTYLLLYGILRFIVEFFRGDTARGFLVGPVSVSQGISILMVLAALAGFALLRRRKVPR